jgi:hypothetical protein
LPSPRSSSPASHSTSATNKAWSGGSPTWKGWDSPASSTEATQRSGDHGAWLTPGHLTARQLVLTGHTHAPTPQACRDAEARLATAAGLDDVQLVVHEHGLARYAVVRRSGPVFWDYLDATTAAWSISLIAGDHRTVPDRED